MTKLVNIIIKNHKLLFSPRNCYIKQSCFISIGFCYGFAKYRIKLIVRMDQRHATFIRFEENYIVSFITL